MRGAEQKSRERKSTSGHAEAQECISAQSAGWREGKLMEDKVVKAKAERQRTVTELMTPSRKAVETFRRPAYAYTSLCSDKRYRPGGETPCDGS